MNKQANEGEELIKVRVPIRSPRGPGAECLWAVRVTEDTARINNIPHLTNAVAFDDLVRVSSSGDFLEVLERVTRTWHATYDAAPDRTEAQREWDQIRQYFERVGIECESANPGLFSLAVPIEISNAQLLDAAEHCPIPLAQVGQLEDPVPSR